MRPSFRRLERFCTVSRDLLAEIHHGLFHHLLVAFLQVLPGLFIGGDDLRGAPFRDLCAFDVKDAPVG